MQRNHLRGSFFDQLPPTGPATKWICILIGVISLVGSVTERKTGIGNSLLIFRANEVLELELWRTFTYAFVEQHPLGLILSILVFWIFGRIYESQWGTRDFVRFCFFSAVGAAFLAIPLGMLINLVMPFNDLGVAQGPGPIIDAFLVSLAVTAPNSNVLLGFVIPVRVRTLLYFILGYELLSGLMNGVASFSIVLGGMVMGYLLTTGYWRPRKLLAELNLWKFRRRRSGIHIVPPKNDTTLH